MKAVEIIKPFQIAYVDIPRPKHSQGEVLIRVMASGICGTDIHIFRGSYMGNYPIIPGHEFSGIIEETGNNITRHKVGDRVAVEPNISCDNCYNCLNNRQNFCSNWQAIGVTKSGAMAQYVTVPEKLVFSISNIPFEHGAFVEPLSCVLHGIDRAKITIADRVLILGAGPIGILILQTVRIKGAAEVTVVERNKSRALFAEKSGADISFSNLAELKQDYYDTVIDATGSIEVMSKAIDFARSGGSILFFGVPHSGKLMQIEPFKLFKKGLNIISSFTSVRNSYQAVKLLTFERIKVNDLISHRLPLEELGHGIELIERGEESVKKVMILPNG